ncbi:MAG: hypothetical protein LBV80_08715 [Deltaproteobacteria bacterium]|jgi:hypothetical protein|nr:hypothetical protein [Deltaproteobacteria bacterium]
MKRLPAPVILFCLTLIFMALPLFGLLAPTALSAVSAQAASAEAPQNLPAILQKAIDNRDAETAAARLDFDRIMADFFKTALPQIKAAAESGSISLPQPLPMLLGSLGSDAMGAGQAAQVLMASEVRKFTLYGIASGSFAGKPLPPAELAGLDGGLFLSFGRISVARKEFSPGKLISRQGTNALIQTSLFDHDSRRVYDLKLALELRDSRWVAVGIANAAALTETLLKEAQ